LVEQILPNLYRIEVPLPKNPLKALNSYVIKDKERSLIIDTGMNREECKKALRAGLNELGVDLKKTDFFITHMHADHSGLVSSLAQDTSRVFCSQPDADIINTWSHWDSMCSHARLNGFPENLLQKVLERHPGFKYRGRGKVRFNIKKEGDVISAGNYRFHCVETPGHTKGHLCLYEPGKKILVAGDHILRDITPNISLWPDKENTLNEYLKSLNKINNFNIELVLPGHRRIFRDCKKRIEELVSHHQARADEVLSIVKKGDKDAFQVASQMSWDLTYESWDLFPVSQKWFATGEAIAHLKYLEEKGEIQRKIREQKIIFSYKNSS